MVFQVVNLDRMADVAAAAPAEGEQQGVMYLIAIFIYCNCRIRILQQETRKKAAEML